MMLKEKGKVTLTFQVEVDTGQGRVCVGGDELLDLSYLCCLSVHFAPCNSAGMLPFLNIVYRTELNFNNWHFVIVEKVVLFTFFSCEDKRAP